MHHDFFAWVRLLLFMILILAFALWCSIAERRYQPEPEKPEQEEQTYLVQAATPAIPLSKTQEATEPPTAPTYTSQELEMLALVIYQEAGADWCSDDTRLMVGTVVMNRIEDPRFPDTMHEVVTEERQYGRLHWTVIVWPDRARDPAEAHAISRAFTIARRILQGERTLPDDVVFQSEYVMGEIVACSDGFYFCR